MRIMEKMCHEVNRVSRGKMTSFHLNADESSDLHFKILSPRRKTKCLATLRPITKEAVFHCCAHT